MDIIRFLAYFIAPLFAVLLWYISSRYRSINKSPELWYAFASGLLPFAALLFANYLADITGFDQLRNFKRLAFFAFIVSSFSVEFTKFVVLRYGFLARKSFKGPLNGIVLSVMISLSFSTFALIFYAQEWIGHPTVTNTLFSLSFTLANVLFAIFMGFFVGMGKYRSNRLIDSLTGLGGATFFHGMYYISFIVKDLRLFILFAAVGLFICLVLLYKAILISYEKEDNLS